MTSQKNYNYLIDLIGGVWVENDGTQHLKIKDKDYKVSKDKMFFVAKDVEHCFHGNTKELKVLYFFGGPDS